MCNHNNRTKVARLSIGIKKRQLQWMHRFFYPYSRTFVSSSNKKIEFKCGLVGLQKTNSEDIVTLLIEQSIDSKYDYAKVLQEIIDSGR